MGALQAEPGFAGWGGRCWVRRSCWRRIGVSSLALLAAIVARLPAGELADVTLHLKAGVNLVSVPLAIDARQRRPDLLFADILPHLEAVAWFDAATQQWQSVSPRAVSWPAVAPPDFAGLSLTVDGDLDWRLVGLAPGPGEPITSALVPGWQCLGVGLVRRNAQTQAWEPGETSLRRLVQEHPEVGLDLEHDQVYTAAGAAPSGAAERLAADDPLRAGRAYWVQRPPPPEPTAAQAATLPRILLGAAAPTGSTPAERDAELARLEATLAGKADAYPKVAEEAVTLGAFVIEKVRYRVDGAGHRLNGLGIVKDLPRSVAALVAVNDDLPFLVDIEFVDNQPRSAFAGGPLLEGDGLTRAVYLAPSRSENGVLNGFARGIPAADLLYLTIAVTDLYPDGFLHIEMEYATGLQGTDAAPGFVEAFTPSGMEQEERSGRIKDETDFYWARFATVFGKQDEESGGGESDVIMSQVWKLPPLAAAADVAESLSAKEQRRTALQDCAAGEWLLNMPESAEEVFEPLPAGKGDTPASFGYDPEKWLVFSRGEASGDQGAERAVMVCTGIERLQILRRLAPGGRSDDLSLPVQDNKLYVDEYGTLWFEDGRARQTRLSWRHGRIEFTDNRWEHIGFWVEYRRGHWLPNMGFTAILASSGTYDDGTQIKDARLDGTLGVDMIMHLRGQAQNLREEGVAVGLFDLISGYFWAMLSGMFHDTIWFPTPDAMKRMAGSSFTLGADLSLDVIEPINKVELVIPIGYRYRVEIIDENHMGVSHWLRSELNLQSESFDTELWLESVYQRFLSRDGQDRNLHTFYVGWTARGNITDKDSPWVGKTVAFEDWAGVKSKPFADADKEITYESEPVFSVHVSDTEPNPVSVEGWSFTPYEFRFAAQTYEFEITNRNWFINTWVATFKHALNRYKFHEGTHIPNCFYVERALLSSRLEAPPEFQPLFGGFTSTLEVEYKEDKPFWAILSGVDRMSMLLQLSFSVGTDDVQCTFDESYMVWQVTPFTIDLAVRGRLIWKGHPMAFEGMLARDADGNWIATLACSDLAAIAGDFEFGRVDSLIVTFPVYLKSAGANQPKGKEFLKHLQLLISGRFDNQEIRDKFGLPDGIELSGMISFPEGDLKSATVTLTAGAIVFQNPAKFAEEFKDIPTLEFEKLSNVVIQTAPGKKSCMVNCDVDLIAKDFVPDPDNTPREQWPRITLGATYTQQYDASGNRIWNVELRGSNLLNFAFNKDRQGANEEDGGIVLKNLHGVVERGGGRTNTWELDATIELILPTRVVQQAHESLCEIPQRLTLVGKYYRTGVRPGWLCGVRLDKKLELAGFDLMLNELILTKQSPWNFGFKGGVGFGGKSFDGTMTVIENGFKFLLPADALMDLKLPGDVGLAVSNFGMAVGKELGLSGDVNLALPRDNPLRAVFGEALKGRLQAGVNGFEVILTVDAARSVDMGPLGQAVFTFDSLKVNSLGAFAGRGRVGVAGRTLGFEIGMQGPSVFFTLDFGAAGVDVDLAGFFKFGVHNKVSYRCIAGAHLVQIDDATIGGGLIPISGFEYHTERLYYVLPVTLPPVGFAFFDSLDGKTYMCGFATNIGFSFPAPTGQDLLTLITFLVDAFNGGEVNWEKLGQLHAPAFGIHDVYLDFPKVPGYMYKEGQWQHTDHVFRSVFGLDRWTFIDRIQLDPGTVVKLASADSIYDVVDVVIPPSAREKQGTLDLRGFRANAGYSIRGDRTLFEEHAVAKLPDLERFVQRVRYVNANTGGDPTELVLRPELDCWSGHDWEMMHRCGHAEKLTPVRDQVSFLTGKWLASAEFTNRNLTVDALRTEAKKVFGAAAVDALYARLAGSGAVTADGLRQALPTDATCLADAVTKYQLQDRVREAFANDSYQAFFGRAADAGGRRYWLRRAFGPCPWIANQGETGHMVYGPYRPVAKGNYQAVFGLRVASHSVTSDVVTLDIAAGLGSQNFASQTLKGTDFAVAGKTENRIVDFTVPADVTDIEFRVRTTGATAVTLDTLRVLAAGSVVTRQVPIGTALGGGSATVRWEGVDIRPELVQLEQLITDLALPANKTWDQHLDVVLTRLKLRDANPEVRDRRLLFAWSPDWRVAVELNRGSRGDINAVHWLDGGLRVRCGRTIVYRDPNFGGSALELTDDRDFNAEPMPDNSISSVKIEGSGQITLYADAKASGTSLTVTRDIADLGTQSFNDQASSVLVFLPIKPYEIKDWRVVATSSSGVVAVLDAGAWETRFPAGERLLWLSVGARLADACSQVRTALGDLRPYPDFFQQPGTWLEGTWNRVMLPLKADGRVDGDATLAFPKYPDSSRTSASHPDWTVAVRPLTDHQGRTISALKLDRTQATLSARYGTVTLFENSNYEGHSTVVTADLPSLVGTEVGDKAASSIRCEGGGTAALYGIDQYRGWREIRRFTLSEVEKRTTNAGAVTGGWRFGSANESRMFRCALSDVPGRYRFVVTCTLQEAGGITVQVPQILGPSRTTTSYPKDSTQMVRLDFVSAAGTKQSVSMTKAQLPVGTPVTFELVADVDQAAMPVTIEMHETWSNEWVLVHNPAVIVYRATPADPLETLTQSDDSLVNNPVGNDQLSAIKVFSPYAIRDSQRYDVSRTLPGGGVLHLTRQEDAPRIGVEMSDTRHRIDCRYDAQGAVQLRITTADSYAFPATGYTLYAGGETFALAQAADAAQHVRVMRRQTQMPEGPLVTQVGDALRTEYQSIKIEPAGPGEPQSKFELPAANGAQLRFLLPPAAGGFSRALVAGSNPEAWWPTYARNDGLTAGIRRPVGTEPGGFSINADVQAGYQDYVNIALRVSGSIETDGKFELRGNGEVMLAGYTLSEAEIVLGSEQGLYIRGKMDLFGVSQVLVEGYLRPDGQFSFTGAASLMVRGSGIRGALTVGNEGLFINGGFYLFDRALRSASFAISRGGKVSYSESLGIGIAGIDYTVWVQFLDALGLGLEGNAWVDLDLPIRIWGPTDWDCCCWDAICWPTDWGWITLGTINAHYDAHFGPWELKTQEISVPLAVGTLKYNLASRQTSVDWR